MDQGYEYTFETFIVGNSMCSSFVKFSLPDNKYLLIINVIILVLFLIHFVRNIIILNDLTEKGSVYNYSNNF